MATTTSTTVNTLQATVEKQNDQITRLLNRVSQLSDQVHNLTTDLTRFKGDVAKDVTYLTNRVDGTE
tara:strand:+ start:628 stop:828 length:201 start_codon:yes stop_codon:yes gene_type:complete